LHLPALVLAATWYVNLCVFLAVGAASERHPAKVIHYPPGLLERSEGLVFALIVVALPLLAGAAAYVYAGLEVVTAAQRFRYGRPCGWPESISAAPRRAACGKQSGRWESTMNGRPAGTPAASGGSAGCSRTPRAQSRPRSSTPRSVRTAPPIATSTRSSRRTRNRVSARSAAVTV